MINRKDADEQLGWETRENGGWKKRVETTRRRCGNCGKPGHHAQTCQEGDEITDVCSSEEIQFTTEVN